MNPKPSSSYFWLYDTVLEQAEPVYSGISSVARNYKRYIRIQIQSLICKYCTFDSKINSLYI